MEPSWNEIFRCCMEGAFSLESPTPPKKKKTKYLILRVGENVISKIFNLFFHSAVF